METEKAKREIFFPNLANGSFRGGAQWSDKNGSVKTLTDVFVRLSTQKSPLTLALLTPLS